MGRDIEPHRSLRAFASRVANGDGEDLVQEAFARALSHGVPCESLPWLKTVVRRLAIDRARRAREVPWGDGTDLEPLGHHDGSPDELLIARERRLAVREALDSLPPRYRDALVAFADDGRCSSVADRLGLSPQASWSLVSRARKRLRDELRRNGFAPLGFGWRFWPAAVAPVAIGVAVILGSSGSGPVPTTRPPRAGAATGAPIAQPVGAAPSRSLPGQASATSPASTVAAIRQADTDGGEPHARYGAGTCTPEQTGSIPVGAKVEIRDDERPATTDGVIARVPSEARHIFVEGCEA